MKKLSTFHIRHPLLSWLIIGLGILILIFLIVGLFEKARAGLFQASLEPFYNTANLTPTGPIGEVLRSEPLSSSAKNGSGQRIIYRSQKADGSPVFSSAMVFTPSTESKVPRPVVAWAHGTIGMGDNCAPSRNPDPLTLTPWIDQMLERGWVVVATDYAGLGTPGIQSYLIGHSEAYDVLNSVRATSNIKSTQASQDFVVWGHSQGGHSALFTASLAANYAPELKLLGTVASAPAAELDSLMDQQYNQPVSWVIGPEVALAWPNTYPKLNTEEILTPAGQQNYQNIAEKCVKQSAIGALIRGEFGQQFFKANPSTSSSWSIALSQQIAPTLPPSQPLLVAESLTDNVVLPNTTAQYIKRACAAGSNLESLWLTNINHIQLQSVIAPEVIGWMDDRFNSRVNTSNCQQPLPINPAT